VNISKIEDIISKAKCSFTDRNFYPRIFSLILKENKAARVKQDNEFLRVCEEEYGDISRRADMTKIQESTSIRNILRTRSLANLLVNDKGEISQEALGNHIKEFNKCMYSLGESRQYDAVRQELILKVFNELKDDKELFTILKTVGKPYANIDAEEIIRNTLGLSLNVVVTDVDAKRAVISALLCYLRQSVGSCFGTAPAIIIHNEQPKTFLKDIIELLGTSRLKRTFGGMEYSVPLSTSWGIGDLKKPFVFSDDSNLSHHDIWFSPGLINALEAISIFPEGLKLKSKIDYTKNLVLKAVKQLKKHQEYFITNIEELLRAILLMELNLKEEDIINFQAKEKLMANGSVFFQPVISFVGGSTQLINKFITQIEIAKTAFKIIADNALLKSWEFTIASFSENKAGFTTWNLYSSLGFKPNEKGGLGESLYEILKVKLDESNQKVKDFQEEYEQAFNQIKYLETRMRTTNTEKELQWLKIEYQGKAHEFHFLEEMRNKIHAKATRLANMFDLLIDIFMYLFPQYFQEVYDASMQDVEASQYDDSPAGFRLLFKFGRGNTAQWNRIYTSQEFIESLVNFFTSTESEIRNSEEMEGLEGEFSQIITALVLKIRSPEFLESAFARMAAAHHTYAIKDPLNHLDKIDKKPWAYVSGGSMATLVTTYYKREQKPHEVSRWVENPAELLTFLVDSIKQVPQKLKEEFTNNPNKSMLIHSPTHAFLLKPGFDLFRQAWESSEFTYTYIRDQLIVPRERFIRQIILDEEMMEFFIDELVGVLPVNFETFIKSSLKPIYKTLTPIEFRGHLIDQLEGDGGLKYAGQPLFTKESLDSKLFSSLPFFHARQLKELVTSVFAEMGLDKKIDKILFDSTLNAIYDTIKDIKILSSTRLQDVCKSLICLINLTTTFEDDYHLMVSRACQTLGFALQAPIIIADSNWVKDYFGFVVNPGTGEFELWRVDLIGTEGQPMSTWGQWLDGSRKDLTWGLHNRPYEYTS
jgi:hypothetical protein